MYRNLEKLRKKLRDMLKDVKVLFTRKGLLSIIMQPSSAKFFPKK